MNLESIIFWFGRLFMERGFTTNKSGEAPLDGYMCGGFGPTLKVRVDLFNLSQFQSYIDSVNLTEADYIGGWIEEDYIYLDVSRNFLRLSDALYWADTLNEKAVWDISNGVAIVNPNRRWGWNKT